jgi:hypothetical protein
MAEVLRRTGANFLVLVPDTEGNTTLNGSTPGQDAIATTNFIAIMWENGELIATNLAALIAGPFNLTIDNVSGGIGGYKVNVTLPNRSFYELWIRHTTAMLAFRQEQFDLKTRPEIGSVSKENVRVDFTIAAAPVPSRNVAAGVLDTMRIRRRFEGATTFNPADLVSDVTVSFRYATLGDTNPVSVEPA